MDEIINQQNLSLRCALPSSDEVSNGESITNFSHVVTIVVKNEYEIE